MSMNLSGMDDRVVRVLVQLNRDFYHQFGVSFAESRITPPPGYLKILSGLSPENTHNVLDIGCGDGRFSRFMFDHGLSAPYTGVDFSDSLLSLSTSQAGRFICRDLSEPDCLAGLGSFDLIVCFSTLQHIPGHRNRLRLLQEMRDHLDPAGRLILANWQFLDSDRQKRKVRDWAEIGLSSTDVEPTDFLLSWQRGGFGYRYVAYLPEGYTLNLAESAHLKIIDQFLSDGREGNLNLYTVWSG